MSELTVIGKRLPRVDAVEKITGQAEFIMDLKLPRMLHGKILGSPHPHARILNINTSKAEKLPGVKAVITANDTLKKPISAIISDQYALATDKVRFIGDDVAAVAAVDEDIAEEALELINVEYEILPKVFDPIEAMEDGAPQIHDVQRNIVQHFEISRGNIEQGFSEAEHVIENTFRTPMVQHCYLEPISCIADCDASGKITLHTAIENPYIVRSKIADYFDMSVSNVRLVQPYIGGAFGGKIGPLISIICTILSRKAQRPVKIVKSRHEEFNSSFTRVPAIQHLKVGVKRDGTICAKEMHLIADNGAYSHYAPLIADSMVVFNYTDALYRCSNIKSKGDLVYTNKLPSHAFRGFGNPQLAFALESQMNIIAEKLNMDPMELRLKNATQQGDITAHGWHIRSCGLSDCIKQATEHIDWKKKRTEKRINRGLGIASLVHVSGNRTMGDFEGSSAFVKIDEDGKVLVMSGEPDHGQGCQNVFVQIAAEVLGVPFHSVSLTPVDTDTSPYALGTFASRVTFIGGNAVKLAAMDARRQLLEIAGKKLEAKVDDLEIMNARVFVKSSPEKGMTISETVKSGLYSRGGALIVGKGVYDPDTVEPDKNSYGNFCVAYPFATHTAEVEVDTDTGQVKVIIYVAAHDLGRVINLTAAEGQVQGGVTQGIGFALTEELVHKDGKIINDTFTDYKILTAPDVPPIESIFVESNDPNGPFGAKGLGETPLSPVAPVIANAIYDAVGVRIKELPITPEKILKALRDKMD